MKNTNLVNFRQKLAKALYDIRKNHSETVDLHKDINVGLLGLYLNYSHADLINLLQEAQNEGLGELSADQLKFNFNTPNTLAKQYTVKLKSYWRNFWVTILIIVMLFVGVVAEQLIYYGYNTKVESDNNNVGYYKVESVGADLYKNNQRMQCDILWSKLSMEKDVSVKKVLINKINSNLCL